jgi:hypothetical protein
LIYNCDLPLDEEKRAEDVLYDMEIVEASAVVLEDVAASINVNSTYNLEDYANAIVRTHLLH